MKIPTLLFLLVLSFTTSCKHDTASALPKTEQIDTGLYFLKVRSIVQQHCTNACHAPSKNYYQGMPIVLETDSNIILAANSIKSAVADSISFNNKRMPIDDSLTATEIELIVKWHKKGGRISD